MRRDLTGSTTSGRASKKAGTLATAIPARVAGLLAAMALGALLIALVYQLPVTHRVDIGGYDSAYVQGFYEPERADAPGRRPWLAGSDGSARWTPGVAYLLFPQAGLPAQVTLRLRGPADVAVLLNGTRELGRLRVSDDWEEHTFAIEGGVLKPEDIVIEIRASTRPLGADDARPVGVLLDRATYEVGPAPITPYPAPLLYGALAGGMLYLLARPPTTDHRPLTIPEGERGRGGEGENQQSPSSILHPPSSILHPPASVVVPGLVVLCAVFVALYRAQPPYPYPLRGLLPATDLVLAALLALRYGPALARRAPVLLDGIALGGIAAWTAAVLLVARSHVVLSIPGVENDFRVFALRSARLVGSFPESIARPELDGVLRADGFYNLGYPLLLRLARPLTQDNPFLAGRLVAALSGALLLAAAWWLARRLLGRGPALLALLALALSPLVVEYALYLGTDMPFAALCTLALALLIPTADHRPPTTDHRPPIVEGERGRGGEGKNVRMEDGGWRMESRPILHPPSSILLVVLAGFAAGAAFLVRHPGILLLPLGWLALIMASHRPERGRGREGENRQFTHHASRITFHVSRFTFHASRFTHHVSLRLLLFTLAFWIAVLPQLAVNVIQAGQPLYNQQAKNIWLCVYADCDWGRWAEAPDSIGLGEVIMRDPGRFLANWWGNLRAYAGTGGEDTSEFGRATQLRLLGFPANWLAIAGLLGWMALGVARWKQSVGAGSDQPPGIPISFALLIGWSVLYVLAVSVGIALPRFFLPLAPIYAIAAAWAITQIPAPRLHSRPGEGRVRRAIRRRLAEPFAIPLAIGLLLIAFLWGGFRGGAEYVLGNQDPDEAVVARLVQGTLLPGERLVARLPERVALGKYSAIAHFVAPAPATSDAEALRASGAQYLLWSSDSGPAPAVGAAVGASGPYTLYQITP